MLYDFVFIFVGILFLVLVIYELFSIPKFIRLSLEVKSLKNYSPEMDCDYFRELPDEKASPAEAVFVRTTSHEPEFGEFPKVFSATILDLAVKNYYEIKVKDGGDGDKDDMVYLEFSPKYDKIREGKKYHIDEKQKDLTEDENLFLEYLLKVSEDRDKMPVNNLKAYAIENEMHKNEFLELIENMQTKVQVSEKIKGNINTDSERQLKKLNEEISLNFGIIGLIMAFDALYLKILPYYYNYVAGSFTIIVAISLFLMIIPGFNVGLLMILKRFIPLLSKKGLDEKIKWKGLERYIKDYTLLDERNAISVHLYEKFLVFGTAFGVSKQTLKDLRMFKEKSIEDIEKIEAVDTKIDAEVDFSEMTENIVDALDDITFIFFDILGAVGIVATVIKNMDN